MELIEGDELVYYAAAGDLAAFSGHRVPNGRSLSSIAIDSNDVLYSRDIETDDRVSKAAARKLNIRSMIVSPLRQGARVVGVLKVTSKTCDGFAGVNLQVFRLLGDIVASALTRQGVEGDRRRQARRQEVQGLLELANHAVEGVVILDGLTILTTNTMFQNLVGLQPRELEGAELTQFVEASAIQAADAGQILRTTVTARSGACTIVELSTRAVTYAGSKWRVVYLQDHTNYVQAESERNRKAAALSRAQEEMSLVFSCSEEAMILLERVDDQWVFRRLNSALAALVGRMEAELVGRTIQDCDLSPDVAESLDADATSCAESGRQWERKHERRTGGHNAVLRISYTPLVDADGQTRRVLTVIKDITEKVATLRRINDVQKLEALGQLAGGVAHDFNNLLQIIDGYANAARGGKGDDKRIQNAIDEIVKAAARGTALVRQLLVFSRRQVAVKRVISVCTLLRDAQSLLRPLLGSLYCVDVDISTDAEGLRVETDPDELTQVIMNLATNARDAMKGGGRLALSLRSCTVDEVQASKYPGRVPGVYAGISMKDDGEGMSSATISKVFQPFFSTKEQGKGTGLGLSMVYGFVEQSVGIISIDSTVGAGTVVELLLPVSRAEITMPEPVALDLPTGRGQTILVVEDEPSLLALTGDLLEKLNYRVLLTDTAMNALEVEMENTGTIDLVLSDLIMPGTGGIELAEIMQQSSPAVPFVFMSGHPARGELDAIALPEGVGFLQKPFQVSDLARAVHKALGSSTSNTCVSGGIA